MRLEAESKSKKAFEMSQIIWIEDYHVSWVFAKEPSFVSKTILLAISASLRSLVLVSKMKKMNSSLKLFFQEF